MILSVYIKNMTNSEIEMKSNFYIHEKTEQTYLDSIPANKNKQIGPYYFQIHQNTFFYKVQSIILWKKDENKNLYLNNFNSQKVIPILNIYLENINEQLVVTYEEDIFDEKVKTAILKSG